MSAATQPQRDVRSEVLGIFGAMVALKNAAELECERLAKELEVERRRLQDLADYHAICKMALESVGIEPDRSLLVEVQEAAQEILRLRGAELRRRDALQAGGGE